MFFKEYVQDIIERDSENIFDLVCNKQAHVYICGSIDMADSVKSVLAKILKGNNYIQKMKVIFLKLIKSFNFILKIFLRRNIDFMKIFTLFWLLLRSIRFKKKTHFLKIFKIII